MPLSRTPSCPTRLPPPPPYEGFTSPYNVDYPVRGWLVTALLPPPWRAPPRARGAALALVEHVGTLYREGHEATDTGLAYAPLSQAHGHHHTQFNVLPCCTAAQTKSVHLPHRVEGGGGGGLLMARWACAAFGGCCSACNSWFPCVLLCDVLGLASLPCVGRPYAQLLCCPPRNVFSTIPTHSKTQELQNASFDGNVLQG